MFWNTALLGAFLCVPVCLLVSFSLSALGHSQGGSIGFIASKLGDGFFWIPLAAATYIWLVGLTIRESDAIYTPSNAQLVHDLIILLGGFGLSFFG
jgi:hypothetical protein